MGIFWWFPWTLDGLEFGTSVEGETIEMKCIQQMIAPSMYCREPRQFSSPKNLKETITNSIVSVKCNCTCTHLSVITTNEGDHVIPTLHIVEMEGNHKVSYTINTADFCGLDYAAGG